MADLGAVDDGRYTAVVDAVEDGSARVFIEQDGEEIGDTVVDAPTLPPDCRQADAVLTVVIVDGEFTELAHDPDRTTARKQDAQNRFDRLSSRPPENEDT